MSYLEPQDFLAMTMVSQDVHATLIEDGLPRATYNINRHLKKFFADPIAFRRIQAETGTLIGGGLTRDFFANRAQTADDIHIFVNHVPGKREGDRTAVLDFLESDGWLSLIDEDSMDTDSDDEDGGEVDDFIDDPDEDGGRSAPLDDEILDLHGRPCSVFEKVGASGKTLTLLCYSGPCPLAQLLHQAPSTASLNLITYDKAYALFPRETYLDKEAYLLKSTLIYQDQFACLSEDGLKALPQHWDDDGGLVEAVALKRPRRIGDKHTWVINLDTNGIETSTHPSNAVIEHSTFRIRSHHRDSSYPSPQDLSAYELDAKPVLRHAIFKHPYVTMAEPGRSYHVQQEKRRYAHKLQELAEKMKTLMLFQLKNVADAEQPNDFDDFVFNGSHARLYPISEFVWNEDEVPAAWTFFDEKIVKKLDELWEEEMGKWELMRDEPEPRINTGML